MTVIEAKKTSDHVEVNCIFSDFTVNNTLPLNHKLISLNILLTLKLTEFDLILFCSLVKSNYQLKCLPPDMKKKRECLILLHQCQVINRYLFSLLSWPDHVHNGE